jgi:CheY-like chemotaxis protein
MQHDKVEILLVEDNPADVNVFQSAMTGPFHISIAEDGAEALDRLFQRGRFRESVRPDVVVIDLNLPLLNGHEVLNAVKANSKLRSIPAIVFSASDNPGDIEKAYEFGASAYLVKPTDLAELEATLSSFVEFWIARVVYPGLMRIHSRSAERGS